MLDAHDIRHDIRVDIGIEDAGAERRVAIERASSVTTVPTRERRTTESALSLSRESSREGARRSPARSRASSQRLRALALSTLAAGSILVSAPRAAHAEEVKPDGKGIVGGALLGAEVVVFAEALFGVRSSTAYLLGAGGGAVAGGIGGYFLEQGVDNGRLPSYLLAGGLALVIPALVIGLNQTRYMPAEGAREDRPVNTLPPSDPGKPGGSAVIGAEPAPNPTPSTTPPGGPAPDTTPTPAPAPPAPSPVPPSGNAPGGGGGTTPQAPHSLLHLHEGGMRIGVPVPEVRPVFSAAQRKALGVENAGSELRFPVVAVTF